MDRLDSSHALTHWQQTWRRYQTIAVRRGVKSAYFPLVVSGFVRAA
jgi:hypothetical protein